MPAGTFVVPFLHHGEDTGVHFLSGQVHRTVHGREVFVTALFSQHQWNDPFENLAQFVTLGLVVGNGGNYLNHI